MAEDRKERLAINLFDLDRIEPELRSKFIKGKVDLANPIRTDWDRVEGVDEVAILFTCDLHTAALACDMIRSHDRSVKDYPTRLYLFRKTWSRVPSYKTLTVLFRGKSLLNPEIFPAEKPLIAAVPLATKRVSLGKK